jgi:ubiquinone/menaquinone biosynthesis C-methylase UbiE
MGMEGPVARWYERTTRQDMEGYRKLADRLRAMLPAGGDVLEVAPGPGFLSIEMARGGGLRVAALDISKTFVESARRNAAEAGVKLDVRLGNAAAMPYPDNSFDLLVCRAAFKNFSEPQAALREMRRVLRPGGTGLIVDLRRDVSMLAIKRYFRAVNLSAASRWFTIMAFRFMLRKRAYTIEEFEKMLAATGFTKSEVRADEIGMEVWFWN